MKIIPYASILLLLAFLAPATLAESVSSLRCLRTASGVELVWTLPSPQTAVLLRVERRQAFSTYNTLTNLPSGTATWLDKTAHPEETYSYRIASLDSGGNLLGLSAACEIVSPLPDRDSLIRFRENSLSLSDPSSSIDFVVSIPRSGRTVVRILTTDAEEILTLFDGDKPAGTYDSNWNGRNKNGSPVKPGIYLVSLSTPAGKELKRIVVRP